MGTLSLRKKKGEYQGSDVPSKMVTLLTITFIQQQTS